ncbi:MAG TPA: hypothetical protein VMH39_15470 [Gemmatimonadaceae bacterium]|nr:hypothetical protein [Gemmatimonadaceae bacterium]
MSALTHRRRGTLALGVALALAAARAAAPQQGLPPTRSIGRTIATAPDSFQSVHDVRQLSDGRVLVNDPAARRLVLLDSALRNPVVVLDTNSASARHYPHRSDSRLLPYPGDTTLFIDGDALALLMIGPSGTVARVVSLPSPDLDFASATTDAAGRLVFELYPSIKPLPPVASLELSAPVRDSAAIVRADLATHHQDTAAKAALPARYPGVTSDAGTTSPVSNPIHISDGWTVLSDGTVAVVRSQEFHVDWVTASGAHSTSPRFPHDWFRITDSTKEALLDSLRRANAERDSTLRARAAAAGRAMIVSPMSTLYPDVSQLPDYRPPFFLRSPFDVSADADGNLWIHEGLSRINVLGGPPVFDVVNPRAGLFDRVQFPGGTVVVGFGPGVVYLSSRNGATSSLVRARIR